MALSRFLKAIAGITILSSFAAASALAQTADRFRVSYGGYNETAAPMWVGNRKGNFQEVRHRRFDDSSPQRRAQRGGAHRQGSRCRLAGAVDHPQHGAGRHQAELHRQPD